MRKRLFFDIETAPMIVLSWGVGKVYLTHNNIIQPGAIICIGYKWAGEKKVRLLQWDREQTDKSMLEEFVPILHEADEICGHNGDRFDIPWVRTRCLYHRIPMMPGLVTIDTLKLARFYFRFPSNRLDAISQFMNHGEKIKTDYELWKAVLRDDPKALARMGRYCKHDVNLLEEAQEVMDPYVPARSHIGHGICPGCGSENMTESKHRMTAAGYHKVQLQCRDCGKYHTIPRSKLGKAVA